jgi:hypothetical protein
MEHLDQETVWTVKRLIAEYINERARLFNLELPDDARVDFSYLPRCTSCPCNRDYDQYEGVVKLNGTQCLYVAFANHNRAGEHDPERYRLIKGGVSNRDRTAYW